MAPATRRPVDPAGLAPVLGSGRIGRLETIVFGVDRFGDCIVEARSAHRQPDNVFVFYERDGANLLSYRPALRRPTPTELDPLRGCSTRR